MNRNASLDPEAHRLIEQASPEPPPSEEACRRMSLKLAPMLAAGAGSLLLKPSVEVAAALNRGSATGLWRWEKLAGSAGGKLAFGALTVALMVGAFCLGRVTSRGAEPVAAAIAQGVTPQGVETAQLSVKTEPPSVDPERPAEPAPNAVAIIAPRAPVSKPKRASTPRSADGLAILGEVELSLRRGNPKAALARLDELGEPASSRLRHLSRVLRAIALCDAGRVDEGRGLIEQIQEDRGSSVFAARLERACESSSRGEH